MEEVKSCMETSETECPKNRCCMYLGKPPYPVCKPACDAEDNLNPHIITLK